MMRKVGPNAVLHGLDNGQPVRVAVAVYPPLWGELLAHSLAQETWVELVGRAAGEDELRQLTSEHAPDVVLLDYEGLGPNSEGVISRLRRLAPKVRVVVLARRSGEETVVSVLRAGAAR